MICQFWWAKIFSEFLEERSEHNQCGIEVDCSCRFGVVGGEFGLLPGAHQHPSRQMLVSLLPVIISFVYGLQLASMAIELQASDAASDEENQSQKGQN